MSILLDALKQAEKEKQQPIEPAAEQTQQPDASAPEKLALNITETSTSGDDNTATDSATNQGHTQQPLEEPTSHPQEADSISLSLHIPEENDKTSESETDLTKLLTETSPAPETTPPEPPIKQVTDEKTVNTVSPLSSDAEAHPKTSASISLAAETPSENYTSDNTIAAPDETQPSQPAPPHATETAVSQEAAQLLTTAATAPNARIRRRTLIFSTTIITTALLASGALLSYSYFYAQTLQQNTVPNASDLIVPITTLKAPPPQPENTSLQKPATRQIAITKTEEAKKPAHPSAPPPTTTPVQPKAHAPKTTAAKEATKTTQRATQPHKQAAQHTDDIIVKPSFAQHIHNLIQKGQYHQAQTLLEANKTQLLRDTQLQTLYIWSLIQQNKWNKALFYAEKVYKNTPTDSRLARLLATLYDHFSKTDQLELLAQQHSSDPIVVYYAASRLLQQNNTPSATILLDKALHTPTPASDLLYLRAYIHALQGNKDSALTLLKLSMQHIQNANFISQRDIMTLYQHIMAGQ